MKQEIIIEDDTSESEKKSNASINLGDSDENSINLNGFDKKTKSDTPISRGDSEPQAEASVEQVINEYFKLKFNFEEKEQAIKNKIIKNEELSKKEKRKKFLEYMPKCIHCKRPSRKGTIFSVTFNPANDTTDAYRTYKALCGKFEDPCNLHIEVNMGKTEEIDSIMATIKKDINEAKNSIIHDKNKLLFGLMTTETALENFDTNKSYISGLMAIYDKYYDLWETITDNPKKNEQIEETTTEIYYNIDKIRDCIKKMNEQNNSQFAKDAVLIYTSTLEPLLNKLRHLRFRENSVLFTDNNCELIQKPYTIGNILISGYTSNVVKYDVSFYSNGVKKSKKQTIVDEDVEEFIEPSMDGTIDLKVLATYENTIDPALFSKYKNFFEYLSRKKLVDEPIVGEGKDGISWKNPRYQQIWDNLPAILKTEFKLNIIWMKEFMNSCANKVPIPSGVFVPPNFRFPDGTAFRADDQCRLTTPPNIILPPNVLENGQYDFGIQLYNKVFNGQSKTLKDRMLTMYKENPDTKAKDYTMLENVLNSLVEKEINFGSGFF